MRKSDIALDKYWVTKSGHFILATTVALVRGITYGKLLYCHSDAEGNADKNISALEYNIRMAYYCLNNPAISNFFIPDLHLPPITIDDRPCQYKGDQYNPDLIPAAIAVSN